MSRRRATVTAGLALVTALVLGGCSGGGDDGGGPSTAPTTSPTPTEAAKPPPAPKAGDCYALTYKQAVSPTHNRKATPCGSAHTSETYAVGELDTTFDGHLLAVDSDRVQAEPAAECPAQASGFLGGDLDALRLSMIEPVWFTPTIKQSDRGASWYRCDVVALSGAEQLADVNGSLKGVLGAPDSAGPYAMCGTAAPDAADFERVPCSADHSWKAVAVVDFVAQGAYPGDQAAEDRGQTPCQDAGAAAADDPLDYEWSYEYPTEEQWDAGMTFGRCWVPD